MRLISHYVLIVRSQGSARNGLVLVSARPLALVGIPLPHEETIEGIGIVRMRNLKTLAGGEMMGNVMNELRDALVKNLLIESRRIVAGP